MIRHAFPSLAIAACLAAAALPAHALVLPLHANDLGPEERVVTAIHATGGGPQTGAKDLRVLRRIFFTDWTPFKPAQTDPTVNANYLIYGKPFYAMASGTVVGCWRNAPENTPQTPRLEVSTGKILLQGNHLWIRQADGKVVLYAHAIPGSIPANLCPHNAQFLTGKALSSPVPNQPEAVVMFNGATVTAGQQLGLVGNSGNSTEPHLHIHMVDSANNWQPMPFSRGMTTPFNGSANLTGPWTPLKGGALPMASILVWPPHPVGNWTWNGIEASYFQSVFDHFVDSGMMPDTIACSQNGAYYDSTWVPSQGSWIAHHGMSVWDHAVIDADLTSKGYTQTSVYTCGTVMAAIWRK